MNLQWLSEIGYCGNCSIQWSFITRTKMLTVHWDIISWIAKLGMFYSMYTLLKMQTTNIVSIRKLWFHIICIPNNIVWLQYLILHLLCLCSHLVVYVYHILCQLRCGYIILVHFVKKVVCISFLVCTLSVPGMCSIKVVGVFHFRAIQPPGWTRDWHCEVRVAKSGKLVGFISAVPALINIYDK